MTPCPYFFKGEKKMENEIKLSKSNELRLKITTDDGKETGEYLTFDLDDISLYLRYQDLIERDKKNKEWLQKEFVIIDKRQDVKGKKLLSKNQEDKLKAINKFFNDEVEVYNMFLGKNGVQKLLNGRKLGWTSLIEIDEIIEKQIYPQLEKKQEEENKLIKDKYKITTNEVI